MLIFCISPHTSGLFSSHASTNLNELEHRADVIEVQLAHRGPDSMRLAYNQVEYMDERKK